VAGQGFFSRTLITYAKTKIGTRMRQDPARLAPFGATLTAFKARVKHLAALVPKTVGQLDELDTRQLTLSRSHPRWPGGAYQLLWDYYDVNEKEQGDPERASAELTNKAPELAARVAGVLQFFYDETATEVSVIAMADAVKLVRLYVRCLQATRQTAKVSDGVRRAKLLYDWLRGKNHPVVSTRFVTTNAPRSTDARNSSHKSNALLNQLEELGYVKAIGPGRIPGIEGEETAKERWQVYLPQEDKA
jgi:Protein of unknown function (DUF3987)